MAEIEKLLKVLDMSEDEQKEWVDGHLFIVPDKEGKTSAISDWSLADLAFRLRDEEGVVGNMHKGIKIVCEKVCSPNMVYVEWWTYIAQPIHWIISSLIAKELAKEPKNVKDNR